MGGTGLIMTLNYEQNLWILKSALLLQNWSVKKCKILALISPLYDYLKYPIKSKCEQASFFRYFIFQKLLKTDKWPMFGRPQDQYKQIQ